MSLKMKNITFIMIMLGLFFLLWGVGSFAEPEKGRTGFGENPDLSTDDKELVFSYYHDGNAALYTAALADKKASLIAKPNEEESYIRPVYSPDGENIAFIKHWEKGEKPYGELMTMDLSKQEKAEQRTEGDNLVTEAAFSPDGEYLYFLMAGVYKHYSPIASEQPHDFDIYRMDVETEEIKQITHKDAYDMSDLTVSTNGEKLMHQSNDSILFYSLEDESEKTLTPTGESAPKETILSSPALSPDGKRVTFSGVANKDDQGTYMYEGFQMDVDTGEAEQVTSFQEHVANGNGWRSKCRKSTNREVAGG